MLLERVIVGQLLLGTNLARRGGGGHLIACHCWGLPLGVGYCCHRRCLYRKPGPVLCVPLSRGAGHHVEARLGHVGV